MILSHVPCEVVSIHSRLIKPGEYSGLPVHRRFRRCFNPLPTNKAGRMRRTASDTPHHPVSIHSRLIKPGEFKLTFYKLAFKFVSIHSRLIKPGESACGLFRDFDFGGFNPLPTNKAGRISACGRIRRFGRGFNPLPTNKAGRIEYMMGDSDTAFVSIHSRLIKPGEFGTFWQKCVEFGVSIHSRLIKPGECW